MNRNVKRRRRCDSCKELRNDVRFIEDPYIKEVENRSQKKKLCKPCVKECEAAV